MKKTDAIPSQDVSEQEKDVSGNVSTKSQDTPETQAAELEKSEAELILPSRDKRLKQIADEVNKSNGVEVDDKEDDTTPDEEQDLVQETDELGETQEVDDVAPDVLSQLGYYQNSLGELVTKVKVNGEEREITADQLKAYAQKDIAADQRLQQAADWDRKLKAQAEDLDRRSKELETSMKPQEVKSSEEIEKDADAFLTGLWNGDEEEAKTKLVELLLEQQRQKPTVDENTIATLIESKLSDRDKVKAEIDWKNSVDTGVKELKESYPDIAGDPELWNLTNAKTDEYLEKRRNNDPEYVDMTPAEMIRKAAEEVQGWYTGKLGSNTRTVDKDKLAPTPSKRGTQKVKPPAPEVDNSPQAVVQRMRNKRALGR